MRKLKIQPVLIFILLQTVAIFFSAFHFWNSELDFLNCIKFFFQYLGMNLLFYRVFLKFCNFPTCEIHKNTPEEFLWMIYILFWLFIFHPIKNLNLVPVYLTSLTNKLLGGKMKLDSFSNGYIFDPHLVEIGSNSFIGAQAMIVPHIQDSERLYYNKIKIGNNVTVGANSIIFPGVIIEDNATIGALSLVKPNAHIKQGEFWAGNPAVKIK